MFTLDRSNKVLAGLPNPNRWDNGFDSWRHGVSKSCKLIFSYLLGSRQRRDFNRSRKSRNLGLK